MFALARDLTGSEDAALVAGAILLMLPYRVLHSSTSSCSVVSCRSRFWRFIAPSIAAPCATAPRWSPRLAAAHRERLLRHLLGLALAALSLLLIGARRGSRPALVGLAVGASYPAALAACPRTYLINARAVGTRAVGDIARSSAQGWSYFSAP